MSRVAPPGLRVLLLTTSYPAAPDDTAGIFVQGFAETLVALGHHVDVVAPALAPSPAQPLSHSANVPHGGPSNAHEPPRVTRLTYARPASLQRTFHRAGAPENLRADRLAWLGALTYPLALGRYLLQHANAFDVLVSHWAVPSAYVATLLPERSRPRHVVVTHGADIHLLEHVPGGARLARRIAHHCSAITFVSATHRARFEALVGHSLPHASVLAMGVDLAPSALDRQQARATLGLEGPVLFTLGRLVPIKGLDVLVEALRGVPDVTLVVAGAGPSREELERLAQHHGVRVRFVGVVLGSEKATWLRAADAFVLPSRRLASGREEGTPTAMLEAMLAGLPVIASDTGGVAEALCDGERGVLVPPDDPAALRAAVVALLANPAAARARARSAKQAAEAQTWSALGPRLDALVRG